MAKAQKGIGVHMKKYRTMIILVAVFVVLVGMYFVMGQMNKSQAKKEVEETIMVTELSNVTAMKYTDGETTMSFSKSEDVWRVTDNDEINLDSDAVGTIANTLSQVQAVRVLEGADEISSYGLEEPTYIITLKTEAGTEVTLYIGNSVDGNYYATTGDKVVVYVIGSSVADALEFDITVLEAEAAVEEETAEEATETETE